MTLDEWQPIVAKLGALFPDFRGDEVTVLAYFDVLRDLDAGDVASGAAYYASTGAEWFPRAGKLRDLALKEQGVRLAHESMVDWTGLGRFLLDNPNASRLEFVESTGQTEKLREVKSLVAPTDV